MDDEIRGILEDLRQLQERVDKYLKNQEIQDLTNPLPIYPQPWVPTIPQTPFEPIPNSRCPKCNLELSPVMGYVCAQQDCPTGLGGPTCTIGYSALTTEGKTLC